MVLPANVNFGTVVGRFIDSEGSNIEGRVTFTPQPKSLLNITADPPTTILPKPVTATLSSGSFAVQLIATDDLDNNPVGWTYQVAFAFTGVQLAGFPIDVPQGVTRDLATLIPVASTSGTTIIRGPGVPETADDGDTVIYDAEAGKWIATPPVGGGGGTGGAVDSVNGQTGVVVLTIPSTPADIGAQPAGTYATTSELSSGLAGKAETVHTHAISDTTGLQAALDAKGTSNLALGTTAGTAKAGNYAPTLADVPAGTMIAVIHNGTSWPPRPTARTDVTVHWIGGTEADPPLDAVEGQDIWDRPAA